MYFYTCFGLNIHSSIELPEIAHSISAAGGHHPSTVTICAGPLEKSPSGAKGGFCVDGDHVFFEVPMVARYSIQNGCKIIVDAVPDAPQRSVRLFLLGTALGLLCFQRGLLPLHANSLVADGGAVAFAGPSGIGKSTLAAHFQRAGYDVLGDDVCALSFDESDKPIAKRGLPRLRLWQDSAIAMGQDCSRLERAFEGLDKYHVPITRSGREGNFPLRRIYVLQPYDDASPRNIVRLRGMSAYEAVATHTYRSDCLGPMGLRKRHLEQCSTLLRHVEVYSAPCRWGFDMLDREAEKFERHFQTA